MAHAAAKAIEDAIAALGAGIRAWQAEAGAQVALLRAVPGRDGRSVPDLAAVAQLARDLQRAVQAGGVPAPLPPQPSISQAAAPVKRAKAGEAVAEGDSEFVFEPIT